VQAACVKPQVLKPSSEGAICELHFKTTLNINSVSFQRASALLENSEELMRKERFLLCSASAIYFILQRSVTRVLVAQYLWTCFSQSTFEAVGRVNIFF